MTQHSTRRMQRAQWERRGGHCNLHLSLSAPDFILHLTSQDLPADAPVLVLFPGLTGGSGDSYVQHAVLAARHVGIRAAVFNSRGTADSPVLTPQFYSASFTEDTREVRFTWKRMLARCLPTLHTLSCACTASAHHNHSCLLFNKPVGHFTCARALPDIHAICCWLVIRRQHPCQLPWGTGACPAAQFCRLVSADSFHPPPPSSCFAGQAWPMHSSSWLNCC